MASLRHPGIENSTTEEPFKHSQVQTATNCDMTMFPQEINGVLPLKENSHSYRSDSIHGGRLDGSVLNGDATRIDTPSTDQRWVLT